ncbi:hypothetical protein [Micromonospora sp. HNM0581]|uniref:hypothetical protein n=1 Tax=Micromonospora sp. HNM0581 TaxID=2716341 RepID=UPI001F10E365|nr:hypothetical protein [Micromonospora sp. HNM0581]
MTRSTDGRLRPLVLTGGSLTVRNEQLLLAQYPGLLVARGAGEPTVVDVIAHFHGDLDLADVRGIGYNGAARGGGMTIRRAPRRTATVANRAQTDILPELDLLDRTFRHRGVAQLETSRGCTNYCSFCPRGHKGIWSGAAPEGLPWMLAAMSEVFERHPHLSRTLYLVDEEFIGRGDDAAQRALVISRTMHDAGFRWESSCRIDQVVDPQRDRAWHLERGYMWRELVATGLRRMLFGVESGVTSILERFNKETTGEQNALAIRTLSALGVPTRFTYITFDHLMTLEELRATHDFQARTDLLLRPLHHLSVEEIVDGVTDPRFVSEHSLVIGAGKLKLILPLRKGNALGLEANEFISLDEAGRTFDRLMEARSTHDWRPALRMTSWTPETEGHMILVEVTGKASAWPVYEAPDLLEPLGNVLTEPVTEIWKRYRFKRNHFAKYLGQSIRTAANAGTPASDGHARA